jgi:predicted exporter
VIPNVTKRDRVLKGNFLINVAQAARILWWIVLTTAAAGAVYLCVSVPLTVSYEHSVRLRMARDFADGHPWVDHTSAIDNLYQGALLAVFVWWLSMCVVAFVRVRLLAALPKTATHGRLRSQSTLCN